MEVFAVIMAIAVVLAILMTEHHLRRIRDDVKDIRKMVKHHFTALGEVEEGGD